MNCQMKLWGVKGSCPGASPGAYRYAVNTSCIELSTPDELILLDAGSGLVFLGQDDRDFSQYKHIRLFLTHYHYDHVIGIPFFKPFYQSGLTIEIYGPVLDSGGPEDAVRNLFHPMFLPMPVEALQAKLIYRPLHTADFVSLGAGEVKTFSTDHPGGNLAYKVTLGQKTLVYLTDLGHDTSLHESLVAFCEGADWLYYDANFTASEYFHSRYEGWGHSTHDKGLQLYQDAHVKELLLGHHALHRTDAELDDIASRVESDTIHLVKDGETYEWQVTL